MKMYLKDEVSSLSELHVGQQAMNELTALIYYSVEKRFVIQGWA